MEQISYTSIEKSLMTYLIYNKGEFCDFTSIYNDFITDDFSSIKDPNVLKQLKTRLGITMMYLDANQHNVTVIKNDKIIYPFKHMVGYMVNHIVEIKQIDTYNQTYQDIDIPTEKEIFNTFIDDHLVTNINVTELLCQGIKFKDITRIKQLINKNKASFYSYNKFGQRPFDLIKDTSNNTSNDLIKDTSNEFNFKIDLILLSLTETNKEMNIAKKNNDVQLLQINRIKNTINYLKCIILILVVANLVYLFKKIIR